jgi:ligand-binding sensor domain-containing protein
MKTTTAARPRPIPLGLSLLVAASLPSWVRAAEAPAKDVPFPVIQRFENFGEKDGIPSHKVHAVLKTTEGKLWIGTYNGLLVREEGKFHRFGPEDGLSHKMVMCLAEDPKTADLWVGTMRGLNRVSGGKITKYTQTDSGLPNNVVYGVDVINDSVWAATAAGTGAMDLKTGAWKLYDHNNTLMHEPWCYAVTGAKELIYIGVWGGGIIEHDSRKGTFKAYRDPDGDFHYDLVPDDGPVADITSWLMWEDGILWQATYFGLSRYDGARWRTWQDKKSPLVSIFVNHVWAHHRVAWVGTDNGLSVTDGEYWVNYRVGDKGEGLLEIHRPGQPVEKRTLSTALANGFVLGSYVDDQEAWFATSNGLSHGVFEPQKKSATVAEAKN